MIDGGCLCGGVRLRVTGPIGPAIFCHCSMCRRASGSAFATNASVASEDFRIVSGAELVQAYESSPGKFRHFCRRCGSPLFSLDPATPGQTRIRLGTVDGDPGTRPALHYAVESKAVWYEIADALPRLESAPSRTSD